MHRTPSQWSNMSPGAVMAGSVTQQLNVLAMAREDIISLGLTLECIMEAAEFGDIDACHEAARQALREANCDQPIRTR